MVSKNWKKRKELTKEEIKTFAQEHNLNDVVAEIMLERGIVEDSDVEDFLDTNVSGLQDPFGLHDMDKALEIIDEAVENGSKIAIYGDYDADGVTSTSIMKLTLKKLGVDPIFYIPDRFKDGYGPNLDVYKFLADQGIDLLITVDNGVSGKDQIQYMKDRGIKVVITDHHDLPSELPNADAIVHPSIPGSEYVCPYLSGAGVAFKIADALLGDEALDLIDLAAIGTVADSVPLLGENRVIVTEGLKRMSANNHVGLGELIKKCKLKINNMSEEDIGFKIAPMINALGRLAQASSAVELLTTGDVSFAKEIVDETEGINKKRQELVAKAYTDSQQQIEQQTENGVLVLTGTDWHQGILGIVASRVVEQTNKPTLVFQLDDNSKLYKGSGRSPEGFNLFEALDKHRDLFASFGGHAQACGFSVDDKNKLTELTKLLQTEPEQQNFDAKSIKIEKYDLDLAISDLNFNLIKQINVLAPFGVGNPKPVIKLANVSLSDAKSIGKDGTHLKVKVQTSSNQVDAIGFGMYEKCKALPTNICDVYGEIGINEWAGRKNLQLMIDDFAVSETGLKLKQMNEVYFDYRNKQVAPSVFNHFDSLVFFNETYYEAVKRHNINAKLIKFDEPCDGENVLIYDRPHNIDLFKNFIKNNQTKHVALYFHTDLNSRYLQPDMEKMKVFLKYLYTHQSIKQTDMQIVADYLHIQKNDIDFYLKVFFELNFVKMVNGFVEKADASKQRDLTESPTYIKRLQRNDVEKILIESNFDDLLSWMSDFDCHN